MANGGATSLGFPVKLTKKVKEDYNILSLLSVRASLKAELVPFLTIQIDNKPIYTNTKTISDVNFWDKDTKEKIIIDLESAEMVVGKNGIPSLIEGSVSFKILNQNLLIDPNTFGIRYPEFFELMGMKKIIFGWKGGRDINDSPYYFGEFNEDIIQSKFDAKLSSHQTLDLTLSFASPLTFLQKTSSSILIDAKDITSGSNDLIVITPQGLILNNALLDSSVEGIETLLQKYNSVFLEKGDFTELHNELNLKGATNPLSFLVYIYNDFTFSEKLRNTDSKLIKDSEGEYIIDRTTSNNIAYFSNLYNKNYIISVGLNQTKPGKIATYDNWTSYFNIWVGAHTNLNLNSTKDQFKENENLTAIIPRIFDYSLYIAHPYPVSNVNRFIDENDYNIVNEYEKDTGKSYSYIISNFYNLPLELNYSEDVLEIYKKQNLFGRTSKIYDLYNLFKDSYQSLYLYNSEKFANKLNREDPKAKGDYEITDYFDLPNPLYSEGNEEYHFLKELITNHIDIIKILRQIIFKIKTKELKKIYDIKKAVKEIYNSSKKIIKNLHSIKPINISINQSDSEEHSIDYLSNGLSYFDFCLLCELNYLEKNNLSTSDLTKNVTVYKNYILKLDNSATGSSNFIESVTIVECLKEIASFIDLEQTEDKNLLNSEIKYSALSTTTYKDVVKNKEYTWLEIYKLITLVSEDEQQQINIDNTTESTVLSELNIFYENPRIVLHSLFKFINKKINDAINEDFRVNLTIDNENENGDLIDKNRKNLKQDRNYSFKITKGEKEYEIKLLHNDNKTLGNLLIPLPIVLKILSKKTILQMVEEIRFYFNKFGIHLQYNIHNREKDKIVSIELFDIDLYFDPIMNWGGKWEELKKQSPTKDNILFLEYGTPKSIILSLETTASVNDSLYIAFTPTDELNSIKAAFKTLTFDKIKKDIQLFGTVDSIMKRLFPKFTKKMDSDTYKFYTEEINKYTDMAQFLAQNNTTNDVKNDINYKTDMLKLFNKTGTYPAHLLFSGITINLTIMGLPGLTSFQMIALENVGIFDGIYMIETVKYVIDKKIFKSILTCKMLRPRLKSVQTPR